MFTPLEIPVILAGVIPYRKRAGAGPLFSNGVYSNRLDQAGLDSPPFDDVKAL
jgi:hypothetical protein